MHEPTKGTGRKESTSSAPTAERESGRDYTSPSSSLSTTGLPEIERTLRESPRGELQPQEYAPWGNRDPDRWIPDLPDEIVRATRYLIGQKPTYSLSEASSRIRTMWGLNDDQLLDMTRPELLKCMLDQYDRRAKDPNADVEDIRRELRNHYTRKGELLGAKPIVSVGDDTINIQLITDTTRLEFGRSEKVERPTQEVLLTTLLFVEHIAKDFNRPMTIKINPSPFESSLSLIGGWQMDYLKLYQFGFKGFGSMKIKVDPHNPTNPEDHFHYEW